MRSFDFREQHFCCLSLGLSPPRGAAVTKPGRCLQLWPWECPAVRGRPAPRPCRRAPGGRVLDSSSRCRALGPTPCPGASVSSPGLRFASADAEWGLRAVSISARRSRRLVQVSGAGRRCRWPLEFARRSSGCGRARPRAEGSVCIFVEGSKGRGHSGRGHPVRGLPKVEDETKGQTKGLGAQSAGQGGARPRGLWWPHDFLEVRRGQSSSHGQPGGATPVQRATRASLRGGGHRSFPLPEGQGKGSHQGAPPPVSCADKDTPHPGHCALRPGFT